MSVFGDFMVSQATKQDEELLQLRLHVEYLQSALRIAVEYGYKQCEKGANLQEALACFNQIEHSDHVPDICFGCGADLFNEAAHRPDCPYSKAKP